MDDLITHHSANADGSVMPIGDKLHDAIPGRRKDFESAIEFASTRQRDWRGTREDDPCARSSATPYATYRCLLPHLFLQVPSQQQSQLRPIRASRSSWWFRSSPAARPTSSRG